MNVSMIAAMDAVDTITLEHMSIDVPLDRVLSEDFPDAHVMLAIAIVQQQFRIYEAQLGDKPSRGLRERALAYGKYFALDLLANHFPTLVERAQHFMIDDAEKDGWHRSDWFGYDTIAELLASLMDEADNTTEYYVLKTMVEKVIPACEAHGISKTDLLSSTLQAKKLRALKAGVLELERRKDDNLVTPELEKKTLEWMIKDAGDRDVTYSKYQAKITAYRDNEPLNVDIEPPKPVNASIYYIGEHTRLIVIDCENNHEYRRVIQKLGRTVDAQERGLKHFIQTAADLIGVQSVEEG